MIELHHVSKTYTTDRVQTLALNDVSLQVRRGEFIALMGPSGCGKSTLLNLIGLLDRPGSGHVAFDGRAIGTWRDKEVAALRNRSFGFVFQSFHLINDLRVIDNVELPLLYRTLGGTERRRLAREALEKVGLAARMHHYPNQLSGGQQHLRPADEPTGNLDSKMGAEIMDLLQQLNAEGTTLVMVTHDEQDARRAHRIVRVFDGRIVS